MIETSGRARTASELGRERDQDRVRSSTADLRNVIATLREVSDLQRAADQARAAMIEHLLAATAAGERADNLRRSALRALEDALAATTQPSHPGELRP